MVLKVSGSIPSVPISVDKSIQSFALRTGPPQVGGGIGPLGLVGPWIGYRVFKKKNIMVLNKFGKNALQFSF